MTVANNNIQVDVVISNCVINLSPDKPAVFAEMFRVLRRGGNTLAGVHFSFDDTAGQTLGRSIAKKVCSRLT